MSEETLSNQELARKLLSVGGAATLATLAPGGGPFASYDVTAPGPDRSPLMLLSRLAEHTKNLERDRRASLLFVREPPAGEGSMTAVRLSVAGRCARDSDADAKPLY